MRVAVIAVVLFVALACEARRNLVRPEEAAKKWAADLGIEIQGVPNCTQVDTDQDGYVTCTIALAHPDGPFKTKSLQCAALTGDGCDGTSTRYASGCKEIEPKPLLRKE